MQGDRKVEMSAANARAIAQKVVPVQAHYSESSLHTVFGVDPEATVREVEKYAKQELMTHITKSYGGKHNIVFDDKITDITPEPISKEVKWGSLPPNTTFVFWPKEKQDDPATKKKKGASAMNKAKEKEEVPTTLNALYKQQLQEQVLEDESDVKKKTPGSSTAPPGNPEMANLFRRLEAMEKILSKQGEELGEQRYINAATEKKLAEQRHINAMIQKELGDQREINTVAEQNMTSLRDALDKINTPFKWILTRCLLDSVREKVAHRLGVKNWFEIDPNQREKMVTPVLDELIKTNPERKKIRSTPAEISAFLSDGQSYVRRQGNAAAHTGEQDDIREAIQTLLPDKLNRRLLSDCYLIMFHVAVDD